MGKTNSKNRFIIIILVAAIFFACAGGAATYMYLTPQKTTIYVFNDNYDAGTAINDEMLTTMQCDSSVVVAGAQADTSSRFVTGSDIETVLNSGDSLRMDVAEGMPLTLSMLSVNGGSTVEMNMDPSKVAVTVPISSISGVTDDLKEGSRVNIYQTGGDSVGTTLIFQNMRVINVGKSSDGTLDSATIEVTVDESLKLIYAASSSSLYFALVDSTGYEYTEEAFPTYEPKIVTDNTNPDNTAYTDVDAEEESK